MRKALLVILGVALLAGIVLPAYADRYYGYGGSQSSTNARVSLFGFQLSDGSMDEKVGSGYGITVDLPLRMGQRQGESGVSIGYMNASQTIDSSEIGAEAGIPVNIDDTSFFLMMTQRYGPGAVAGKGPYLGTGVGIMRTRLKADVYNDLVGESSENNFAYQLIAGLQLSKKAFAEVRYFDGGDDANTGWAIGIGMAF
jgi:opacity protein-like surface antigen